MGQVDLPNAARLEETSTVREGVVHRQGKLLSEVLGFGMESQRLQLLWADRDPGAMLWVAPAISLPKIDNCRPQTGLNHRPGLRFSSFSHGPGKATTNRPHEGPPRKQD
jgi:hypothetical protein